MSWYNIPPGNILQNLYLNERIKKINPSEKNFLEIGAGTGYVSRVFLENGWNGIGIDLNNEACHSNKIFNEKFIKQNQYEVINDDFFKIDFSNKKFDVIISCMVIEHLIDEELNAFMKKALSLLNDKGTVILQVPSNMKYWNIEDDIAGHIKRYELRDVQKLAEEFHCHIHHIAALNYPLSNWLFSLSNFLIKKQESDKLNLSQKEKTVYTGKREVFLKTKFPAFFVIFLNPSVLYPFHILQKLFSKKYDNALVLYFELTKK